MSPIRKALTPAVWLTVWVMPLMFAIFGYLECIFLAQLPKDATPNLAHHQQRWHMITWMALIIGLGFMLLHGLATWEEKTKPKS